MNNEGIVFIEIINITNKLINSSNVIFFIIKVKSKTESWVIEKRYNDFHRLYTILTSSSLIKNCPVLPKKSIFKLDFNELIDRRQCLNQFLNECLVNEEIVNSKEFSQFIKNENSILLDKKVVCLFVANTINILFVLTSDYIDYNNSNNLLDEYTSTSNNGELIGFSLSNIDKTCLINSVTRIIYKSFQKIPSSLYFNENSKIFLVGFQNGSIIPYNILNPYDNLSYVTIISEIQPHTKEVVGLYYDSNNDVIYSISKDKTFYMSALKLKKKYIGMRKLMYSNYEYTGIKYYECLRVLFLSNSNGIISVFDIGDVREMNIYNI